MVDLEGQDHGPSSSSVGDNDDDFIVYSKEDNATAIAMECTEEVFLAKIIHGDGAKVIKVGEVNATEVDDEDDIAKFKDYKPSQLGDSKEVKVPSILPHPPHLKRRILSSSVQFEPKKPKVANAPQSGARIFASPLARKLTNDHNVSCKANSIHYKKLQAENGYRSMILYHSVNVAVQTEHGLFVPVVRDADKKGLSKIVDEVKSFTQKAKENSLKPEDYEVRLARSGSKRSKATSRTRESMLL
ncbi:hypothetical protein Sjap_017946 [Stephania japonica]|uniref:2-oxoacid dehydrogenase acyltransferase catalytic domain-containing protein n=1 Tax=Stephania japonica TaxID=461633 RepID=A0AAP0NML4_9MAGN